MPDRGSERAPLMVPMTGHHGGKKYPVRGILRGHEGEWFRVKRGRQHHRVVKIGPDGLSEETSYRVPADAFEELALVPAPEAHPEREVCLVGPRGSIQLAERLRKTLGIHEGAVVIQEERDGGVWIRPADVIPRVSGSPAESRIPSLEDLLEGITPENLHEEVDFGQPVGRELI